MLGVCAVVLALLLMAGDVEDITGIPALLGKKVVDISINDCTLPSYAIQ